MLKSSDVNSFCHTCWFVVVACWLGLDHLVLIWIGSIEDNRLKIVLNQLGRQNRVWPGSCWAPKYIVFCGGWWLWINDYHRVLKPSSFTYDPRGWFCSHSPRLIIESWILVFIMLSLIFEQNHIQSPSSSVEEQRLLVFAKVPVASEI